MSAVWTLLINLPSPVGNHCTASPVNSLSGAGGFLTGYAVGYQQVLRRLNAPSGAGCFLTKKDAEEDSRPYVLMHLLVLGAF